MRLVSNPSKLANAFRAQNKPHTHEYRYSLQTLPEPAIMASASEDDVMGMAGDMDDDLFGSEDGGAKVRELSDRELDSGDDENRYDRVNEKPDEEEIDYNSGREARILGTTVWRHPLPNPADGEVSLQFIKLCFQPDPWNSSTACAYPNFLVLIRCPSILKTSNYQSLITIPVRNLLVSLLVLQPLPRYDIGKT
jgi:hypothetical protein